MDFYLILNILPEEVEQTQIKLQGSKVEEVTNFPILRLKVTLPKEYPESASPEVEVMNEFYKPFDVPSILQKKYDELELKGLETIYIWFDHCKTQLVTELIEQGAFEAPLPLDSNQYLEEKILTKNFEFDQNDTQCNICFETIQGRENFLVLVPCLHAFCKDCMGPYSEMAINEGQIEQLVCPCMDGKKKCQSVIREVDLEQLDLEPTVMYKYIDFSIKKGVDAMEDMGWCPKCKEPTVLDLQK